MKTRTGDANKAVAILRTSTEDQNLGPEAQRGQIERWFAAHGVAVVAWHEDRLSGATPAEDRPGLMAALADVRKHRAGLLVAAKRDRLARDVVVAACIERLALDAGAKVVTADGAAVTDTPEGQMMKGILDVFAAYERAIIRARTKAALSIKRSRGERVSGRAPLGYRFDGSRLVADESEQAALGRARDLRAKGLSFARCAAILNAEGAPCRGRRWHSTSIQRALRVA